MKELFLVTGGAGFIGGHLTARLLAEGGRVRVLDNFSTGSSANLPPAEACNGDLEVVRGDIRDLRAVEQSAAGAAVIFHQAAMRSVPRSIADPLGTNAHNATGTLHVFEAARRAGVRRVVYASSSSVHGNGPGLPQREDQPPSPASPYGASKLASEHYASVWHRLYGVETVGLRYFNVFGPRQDPTSEYAAVIPKFILWALAGTPLEVHGDGTQSRDFTYVDNVVDANVRAADAAGVGGDVFNVGCGGSVSLLEVIAKLEDILRRPLARLAMPRRLGDVNHTFADITKARRALGYAPTVSFDDGLARTVEYFQEWVRGAAMDVMVPYAPGGEGGAG